MTINPFGHRLRLRVGLLGGSFNPAHDGHRHVSLTALRRLRLDQVWWLVSPQNPLKPAAGMAPQGERIRRARQVARHPRIRVTGLEARLGTRYTADTLAALHRRFPGVRFVWLMGADNLRQMPRWRRWQAIFGATAIAVFDRRPYSFQALAGQAARRYAHRRIAERQAFCLADRMPPAWVFLHSRLHPASATAIRAREWTAAAQAGSERSGPFKL
jgi:nicotinate-nucleotide adenylyltransferase